MGVSTETGGCLGGYLEVRPRLAGSCSRGTEATVPGERVRGRLGTGLPLSLGRPRAAVPRGQQDRGAGPQSSRIPAPEPVLSIGKSWSLRGAATGTAQDHPANARHARRPRQQPSPPPPGTDVRGQGRGRARFPEGARGRDLLADHVWACVFAGSLVGGCVPVSLLRTPGRRHQDPMASCNTISSLSASGCGRLLGAGG